MRLRDKVAFISGAANGIGHAAAVLFAQEGAAVMLADRDAKLGARAADERLQMTVRRAWRDAELATQRGG